MLAPQPFPAVQTDLHGEAKLGLNASLHETEHRMHPVVIKEEAFAQPRQQVELLVSRSPCTSKLRQGKSTRTPARS